ncbi:MAG: cupin domain-containing protein [Atribacterota bacterium]|nr:cupin domain-containing protein [Candidatus Atribacteria bacterium]
MIKRGRKDVPQTTVDQCHDGVGTIKVRQLLGIEPQLPGVPGFPDDFDSTIRFMHETTLPVGTSIGFHDHRGNEELYYVLDGKGEMTVDDQTAIMEPGDVCLTKSGSKHTFRNVGNIDLKIVVLEALIPRT